MHKSSAMADRASRTWSWCQRDCSIFDLTDIQPAPHACDDDRDRRQHEQGRHSRRVATASGWLQRSCAVWSACGSSSHFPDCRSAWVPVRGSSGGPVRHKSYCDYELAKANEKKADLETQVPTHSSKPETAVLSLASWTMSLQSRRLILGTCLDSD